jgi:O-antigen/teichoic acid export membrane protein
MLSKTAEVGLKTMQGASLMVLRTLVLYPVGFAGEVCLARLLSPQDFGIYAIASFVTVTLAGVMEVGLAASLIQRPEEASDREYQILFTFQIVSISVLVLVVFFAAPWFFPLLNLDVRIRWTVLILLLCPWISSFGTISNVKLERKLRYAVFAKIDVFRGLTYVTVSVGLAYLGAKWWSFVAAIIASTLVKTWVTYRTEPWPLGFRFSLSGMGKTLHFGILFQLSTLTSLFRDHIAVTLGGPLFGPQSVGYLNWAKNTTYYTSQIFTQVVSRVAFPSISRIQHDSKAVGQMTESILKYVNFFTFPAIFVFAALIPEFVATVFTDKWQAAIPAFYFMSLRMVGSNFTTLYVSVLNGLGQVKASLRILVWWTIADWTLAVVLCRWFGFTGIAIAYGLSVLPISCWLIYELSRFASVRLRVSFFLPLLLSLAVSLPIQILKTQFPVTPLTTFGLAFVGLLAYLLLLIIVEGRTLLVEGRLFLQSVYRRT